VRKTTGGRGARGIGANTMPPPLADTTGVRDGCGSAAHVRFPYVSCLTVSYMCHIRSIVSYIYVLCVPCLLDSGGLVTCVCGLDLEGDVRYKSDSLLWIPTAFFPGYPGGKHTSACQVVMGGS